MYRATLALALATAAAPAARAADPPRWNLLLVTADDLNADSAGWMGNPLGATPNVRSVSGARIELLAEIDLTHVPGQDAQRRDLLSEKQRRSPRGRAHA